MPLPSSSQPAPPTAHLDVTSFQPSDVPQPDRHNDDTLQPTDQPHHTPVAAPPYSHASGNLAQVICPPSQLKTEGQSEETTQETTDHDFKPDQTSSSPLLPSPDSELYWSPWLYTDLIIPYHQSGSSALTCSLPPFPHCPGPLLISEPSPVHRPQMSSTFSQEHPQLAAIYQAVQAVGTPNYRGARQPVPHNLNIPAWRDRSHLFPDTSLVEMLEFGFPIGYTASHPPAPHTGNHPSANQHPADIDAYLDKELRHSAIIGPADRLPFQWPRTNPMMTRPKKDSSSRRVIVDLSMPQDASVNSGIPRNSLDGAPFKLRLPNPATLAAKILEYGPGCLLYKVDLSRAYRQLRTDPLDWPFLMLQWDDQHYLDISIPFGLRHGASACQRTTEAVSAIAKEEAGADTAPYIDDTIGAALPQDAWPHYHHLLDLMSQLGLDAAQDKCEGPTTRITWIGVLFDTIRLTMAIDPAKVEEARLFCLDLMSASSIPVKKFQKFLGKLFHATKCTTGARTFFNRLLDALATERAGSVSLGPQAKADIHWFLCFLGRFNGVTLIKPSVAQHVIHVDSCLQGGGGLCSGLQFYKISYPQFLVDLGLSISSLECWNLLVAARIWLPTLSGTTVLVFCDNWATVAAINSGRATDPIIRGSLRELWWLAASHDVQLEVRHKPGADMIAADTLSRATTSSTAAAKFAQFAHAAQESEVQPLPSALLPPFPF